MKDKMYICPKAKWCLKHRPECHIPIRCPHVDKHKIIIERGKDCCNNPTELCPACIPVEPEPKTTSILCMDCNKPIFEEQPTPTMPLAPWDWDKRLEDFNEVAVKLEVEGQSSRSQVVLYLIERCKRAEAHDSEVAKQAVKEFAEKGKLIWYILDEIACKHSATHMGSGKQLCPICDRAEEAMKLCQFKPTPKECQTLFESRRAMVGGKE